MGPPLRPQGKNKSSVFNIAYDSAKFHFCFEIGPFITQQVRGNVLIITVHRKYFLGKYFKYFQFSEVMH